MCYMLSFLSVNCGDKGEGGRATITQWVLQLKPIEPP